MFENGIHPFSIDPLNVDIPLKWPLKNLQFFNRVQQCHTDCAFRCLLVAVNDWRYITYIQSEIFKPKTPFLRLLQYIETKVTPFSNISLSFPWCFLVSLETLGSLLGFKIMNLNKSELQVFVVMEPRWVQQRRKELNVKAGVYSLKSVMKLNFNIQKWFPGFG